MGAQKFSGGILDSLGMYFWHLKGTISKGELSLHLGLCEIERIEFFLGSYILLSVVILSILSSLGHSVVPNC